MEGTPRLGRKMEDGADVLSDRFIVGTGWLTCAGEVFNTPTSAGLHMIQESKQCQLQFMLKIVKFFCQ